MQKAARTVDTHPMKKFLMVALAVVVAIVILKVVLAVVSAVIGLVLFVGTLALLGFGAVALYRHLTRA